MHFDEITLYKGASSLNYLCYLLGEDVFMEKLRKYIKDNINKENVNFDIFRKYFLEDDERKTSEIFRKLLENEGVVKLECVLFLINFSK